MDANWSHLLSGCNVCHRIYSFCKQNTAFRACRYFNFHTRDYKDRRRCRHEMILQQVTALAAFYVRIYPFVVLCERFIYRHILQNLIGSTS